MYSFCLHYSGSTQKSTLQEGSYFVTVPNNKFSYKRIAMTRYIFTTGGVVSSLGKGIASASLGAILEARGLKVTLLKLDPYINVDPGTMNRHRRWGGNGFRPGPLRAFCPGIDDQSQ
jgi:hypothetical protein